MSVFDYSAQCTNGAAIGGTVEAADHASAIAQLEKMGLVNVDLTPAQAPPVRRTLGRTDFIFFNEQLASLAQAGVCLDEGLRQLARDVGAPGVKRVLEQTANDLESGLPLDQALAKHQGHIPPLYGRAIKAGVENGQLAGTLLNLSHHLRLVADTRRLLIEAISYPLTVLVVALTLLCLIFGFLVPQFKTIFEDFDARLPGLTEMVLTCSAFLPHVLIGVVALLLLVLACYLSTRVSTDCRLIFDGVLLRIPLLGPLLRDSLRARFLRAAAFSFGSGIPLPEALRLGADSVAHPAVSKDAEHLAGRVEQGASVFEASHALQLIPPGFAFAVDACTRQGNLPEVLTQLAGAYESRAVHSQSVMRTWIGPALVVGVGMLVGLCVVSMFMPLVSLIESVG